MDRVQLTVPFDGANQRRAHDRRALHCPAKLMLAGKRIVDLRVVNISVGGLAVIAPADLGSGTTCQLRFDLPQLPRGYVTMYLAAVVVNSIFSGREDGFKLGLNFVQVNEAQATLIARFVQG